MPSETQNGGGNQYNHYLYIIPSTFFFWQWVINRYICASVIEGWKEILELNNAPKLRTVEESINKINKQNLIHGINI